ncbi:MAG: 16S rRNA (uracil(1498)-N(3))-methyltransferase [Candidatus Eremiobacteraeota bacterium]|nr:16S rRNA (uracil(1498)-N(3))-methyltransferase [Candidatus Eremiobacteraeota bacterium]
MSAPRFFVAGPLAAGAAVTLQDEDLRHARLVLRLQPGDAVVVVGDGAAWDARVSALGAGCASVEVTGKCREPAHELPQTVTMLQAVPKGAKMDFVIEKAVELGAARIVPVRCARSYADLSQSKLRRWRMLARAAAQQSRRLRIPDVESASTWASAVERFAPGCEFLLAHEGAARGSLRTALGDTQLPLTLAVGPEGGFTQDELDLAVRAGARIVSLGPTILRTETAPLALLAAVACARDWW